MGFFDLKLSPAIPGAVVGLIALATAGHYGAELAQASTDVVAGAPIVGGIVGAAIGAIIGRKLK